jgi:hypothetical protein
MFFTVLSFIFAEHTFYKDSLSSFFPSVNGFFYQVSELLGLSLSGFAAYAAWGCERNPGGVSFTFNLLKF